MPESYVVVVEVDIVLAAGPADFDRLEIFVVCEKGVDAVPELVRLLREEAKAV